MNERVDYLGDLMSEEDLEHLNKLIRLRKDLMSYIGIGPFIDFIRKTIDETEGISFKSEVARKFIDKNKPVFVMKIEDEKVLKEMNNAPNNDPTTIDFVTKFIVNKIVSKVSKFLLDNIESNEILNELYNSLNEDVKKLSFTNIYIIRVSLKENTVNFEYFI